MTALTWDESYLGRLRAIAGDEVLLFVSSRCVLRDEVGRVLLIQRSDNQQWAFPAGALELGESIAECAVREVAEETGLRVQALTPFAMYSGKSHIFTNMFGDTYQLHTSAFRIDTWDGDLRRTTDETVDAAFFPTDALPRPLASSVSLTLADLARYEATGGFVLG